VGMYSDFFVANFRHFATKKIQIRIFCHKVSVFYFIFAEKWKKNFKKINTIASSMKGCLRHHISNIANLAKYAY
jgi:hypothetical protein